MEAERVCPHCEQQIPQDEWQKHENGRDPKRLECPIQDLDKVAKDQEPATWADTGLLPDRW